VSGLVVLLRLGRVVTSLVEFVEGVVECPVFAQVCVGECLLVVTAPTTPVTVRMPERLHFFAFAVEQGARDRRMRRNDPRHADGPRHFFALALCQAASTPQMRRNDPTRHHQFHLVLLMTCVDGSGVRNAADQYAESRRHRHPRLPSLPRSQRSYPPETPRSP
jgi:hypothetical protein